MAPVWPEIIAIQQIDYALLSARQEIIGAVDEQGPACAQVVIVIGQKLEVVGREPVGNAEVSGVQPHHTV